MSEMEGLADANSSGKRPLQDPPTYDSAELKKQKISGASAEKKYLLKTLRVLAIIQYGFRGYRLVSLCIRCKKNDKFKC